MTPSERRAQLRIILDQHNDAARAFRASSEAFDSAADAVTAAVAAIHAANNAQRDALDALITANAAALALFNDE